MPTMPAGRTAAALATEIENAVASDRVTILAGTLARLARAGALDRDEFYPAPRPERYTRKLVWRDPAARFIIVGMTWNPGHAGALHDHAGLWGSEIVVDGTMEERAFRVKERDEAGRYRFVLTRHREMPAGAVGTVSPPIEYHAFGNAGGAVARTVHVYAGDLLQAQTFASVDGEWYAARSTALHYD